MTELVKNVETFNAPIVERPASIMDIIGRAANDPSFDVNKFERLLEMHERITAKEAKAAYMAALVAMKPKLPVIDRKGRIEVREKTASGKRDGEITQSTGYARWEDIDEAITPILHDSGFALTFRSGVAQDGKITVTGVLGHSGGHSEETTITLPHDSSGSKNAVQAVGSSTSYGKRYTATLLLNIRTKGEDDDGEKGGAPGTVSEDQVSDMQAIIKRGWPEEHDYVEKFCEYLSKLAKTEIKSLADLPREFYAQAVTALNLAERKKTKK